MKSNEPAIRMALQSWSDRPAQRSAHASESVATLVRRFWPACYAAARAHDLVPRRAMTLTRRYVEQTCRAGSRVNRLDPDCPLARDVIAQRLAVFLDMDSHATGQKSPFNGSEQAALPHLSSHAMRAFTTRWAAQLMSRAAVRTCGRFAGRQTEALWREYERRAIQPFMLENDEPDGMGATRFEQPAPLRRTALQAGTVGRYAAAVVQRSMADAIIDQIRRTVYHEDLIDAELRVLIQFWEMNHE